jgi:hypothetical protein
MGEMVEVDVWAFRDETLAARDLTGFSVEAIDGSIGKIDKATNETGSSRIVVDTGPWIFGKKVMLPVGVIDRVDLDNEDVYVNRTKDQIKSAPEYDESYFEDAEYRGKLGAYYGPGGAGWRDWN